MTSKEPTREELLERIAKLEKPNTVRFQVSEKGGVSLYGLGRFPVTLYYEQWLKVFDNVERLKKFIEDNESILSKKVR